MVGAHSRCLHVVVSITRSSIVPSIGRDYSGAVVKRKELVKIYLER